MLVGSIVTLSNPAACMRAVQSSSVRAPAIQPVQRAMIPVSCGESSRDSTMSEIANRPPGLRTRRASRKTAFLSAERLTTQFEMITSTELSGSGMLSMVPSRNSTLSTPALALLAFARASISGVMSSP